jgi:uroporphyrinogen decarboxylase
MNGRERILAAINHTESDRVPRDLGSTPSSGISAVAYCNLLNCLHIEQKVKVYDVVQQVAQPDEAILDRFKIDAVDPGRTFNTAEEDWKPFEIGPGMTGYVPKWFETKKETGGGHTAYAGDRVIARMPAGATFFDQTIFSYIDGYPASYKDLDKAMSLVHWSRFSHSPWDHSADPGFWETLRTNAEKLRNESGRALVLVGGCNLFEWGTFLRRMDNFLCDLVADPDSVEGLLDALLEHHLAFLDKVCKFLGDICDIFRFGDDLGMDSGPFMNPNIYRCLFKKRHKIMTNYVQNHSRMKIFLHSCGSIIKLIPDLIEAGFEILNPVQFSSAGMESATLKKEFGKDITFWGGGCDTRRVLNRGTAAEVKDHVKKQIDVFAPGGGFVFNTVHNIMPDCPPENITAMFEALDEIDGGRS